MELSSDFAAQITGWLQTNPGLAGRMQAQIEAELPFWEPGLEDKNLIKHVRSISKTCGYRVYRLKNSRALGLWRVIFFELNRTKPRKRYVVIADERDDDTYDENGPLALLVLDYVRNLEREGKLTRRR